MKSKNFGWYMIVGHPTEANTKEEKSPLIYFVESESPHNVLKYHGGQRRREYGSGRWGMVQFPTNTKDIHLLPHWNPESVFPVIENLNSTIKIIPITIYRCACGEEHYSEYPYPSMWCKCGQKAYPVEKSAIFRDQSRTT